MRAFHGSSALIVPAIHKSCPWLKPTPFGAPVVPEVKRRVARSDVPTGARRARRPGIVEAAPAAGSAFLPSARNAFHERTHEARSAGTGSRQKDPTATTPRSAPAWESTAGAPISSSRASDAFTICSISEIGEV